MKRVYSIFLSICMAGCLSCHAQVWPDGSPIGKWFVEDNFAIPAEERRPFKITDFGAKPDSTVLQTAAIQAAIDAAAENGGTVIIPRGVWLSSSLFFKPHTHLRLDYGAVLKGSDDISDYPVAEKVHIEGVIQPYIAALVNAYGVDGFSITGEGVIDGNGLRFWRDFWKRREVNPACTNLEALRPRMIYIANASDIHLEGVTFRNSGFWTTHLYKCDRVKIKNVTIFAPNSPVKAPSSDAIDLDVCNDVHITGCNISVNDDIIAVKGGKGPWADKDPDNGTNSNILVENCRFGKGPGVITFGSECIGGRNVILRDSEVHGADRLLWLKMRPDTPQLYEYILVENITGECRWFLYVHPWTQFFDLKGRKDIPMSYGKHITMRGCRISCEKETDIVEKPDQYELSGIVLENNEITVK